MSEQDTTTPGAVPPKPSIPGAKPVIPGVTPAGTPRATSRITPPGMDPLTPADNATRTVRLKPITPPKPVTPPPAAKPPAGSTTPIPGGDPIPDGPRPPTPAQVQAAKSKTSRISLEQAISMDSVTPRSTQQVEPANVIASPAPGSAPRTIRLKRPTEMPTLKVNAVPPAGAASVPVANAEAAPDEDGGQDATVTQKRTLKVRRPGAPSIHVGSAPMPDKKPDEELPEGMTPIDSAGMTPLAPMAPPEKGNPVFVTFGILAILATLGLCGFMVWQLTGEKAAYFAFF